jgi:hypothetical protein
MAVTHAARAGAQFGAQSSATAVDEKTMQAVAMDDATANDVPRNQLTAHATHSCACFDGSSETSLACTAGTCANQLRVYVTVTTQTSFATIVDYPGIPHTLSIVRTARLRAQ